MRFFHLLISLTVCATGAMLRADYTPIAGNCTVATYEAVWHDATRNRDIPVKVYYPAGEHAPKTSPVIVFSHGLGGSREGYSYLGEAWAAHGFISVHPQHPGSDDAVLKAERRPRKKLTAFKHAAADPANLVDRPKDIAFVIDRLTALNKDATFPLHGRLELAHLGVAGHSFGAYTVMAVAGQAIGPAGNARYFGPDERVVAAIAMSSQPASVDNLDHAYDKIRIPIFHMTGTKDESVGGHGASADDGSIGHTSAAGRRVAFDRTKNAPACLLTFKDGDHMVFSGRDVSGASEAILRRLLGATQPSNLSVDTREAMHRQVVNASVAFWNATLRHDTTARDWLERGGFARALGALGTFEQKQPKDHPASQ